MESGVLVTSGAVIFAIGVIGGLYKFFSWIIGIVQNSVIREKNVDTRQENIEKSIISLTTTNTELKTLIANGLSENAKNDKKTKKKQSKEIKRIDTELKAIPTQNNEIKNVKEEQGRFKTEMKELKTEMKETYRVVVANEGVLNGINGTILSISDNNRVIMEKLEKLSEKQLEIQSKN